MYSVNLRAEGLMRLTTDKNLSGEENYIFLYEINHIMGSCLATMPTELGRFFKYSTVYRYLRISILDALLTCEAFLHSVRTSVSLSILITLSM
jgi:hypothetical protein